MSSTSIIKIDAWEALDSRGQPTVACKVSLSDGSFGVSRVPAGASTGRHEAPEQRDGERSRYRGKGVRDAVRSIDDYIAPALIGNTPENHDAIDHIIADVQKNTSRNFIGANATLAVSMAALLAIADHTQVSLARLLQPRNALTLPMPMVNIISGGEHANQAIDLQDFLIIPEGADSFTQAIEWCVKVRDAARVVAEGQGFDYANLVADEGGLGVGLKTNESALQLLSEAVESTGLALGSDITFAIDAAATEFARDDGYFLAAENRFLNSDELIGLYSTWVKKYPIRSIEDPLGEDDWNAWRSITRELGGHVDLVGDDLFVTQMPRLEKGIIGECGNSILVKVNQNGLVSKSQEVLLEAQRANYRTVVSARSGETEDAWVADLATGWRAGQLKVGSTQRSERTAKWNRLLELEATDDTSFRSPWNIGVSSVTSMRQEDS